MIEPIFNKLGKGFCIICDTPIGIKGRETCSKSCHEELVKIAEGTFGASKMVTDSTTGISYKVPTRDIIEKGLAWKDLAKYPVWKDGEDGIETKRSLN